MILALDRLAEADLHAPRRDWTGVARGLHAGYVDAPDEGDPAPSLLIGASGILLTSWLLSADPEAADLLADAVAANIGNETNELLWGSPGTMIAASVMLDRSGEARWAELWRASARQLLDVQDPDGLWTQRMYGRVTRYVGAGHGFAGNVHALSLRPELLDDADAVFQQAVATAAAHAVRRAGQANWPGLAGTDLGLHGRTQWCHGAPGIITSLARLEPEDSGLTTLLEDAGELVWRAGPLVKGPGLCHGTAGNGFAFLALLRRTGEERWLERARAFAMHAAAQVDAARSDHSRGRYTLWTGDIGAAIFLARCLRGDAGFPTLDAW
jgi:hypothetical protein